LRTSTPPYWSNRTAFIAFSLEVRNAVVARDAARGAVGES
jgi:hypothetical protein